MKRIHWCCLPLILFVALMIFFWRGLSLNPHQLPSALLNKPLPFFQLNTINEHGIVNRWLTPEVMRGRVVLLNVWASWCPVCSEEQAFLLQLTQKGVLIYGLNYKDDPRDAARWLEKWGNPYQQIGSDRFGRAAMELGVYGAPETFLIDKKGIIRYRHAGVLNKAVWQTIFLPRMRHLEHEA